jgi:hypothetical protein
MKHVFCQIIYMRSLHKVRTPTDLLPLSAAVCPQVSSSNLLNVFRLNFIFGLKPSK